MKIGMNARFLTQPYTGIGQYTINLLKSLAKADDKNEYFLFTPELVELNLPERFHQIRIPEADYKSASLRKAHWEFVLIPREMAKWQVNVAHFLYPANPLTRMAVPVVTTVHDVIPWVLPEYQKRLRSQLYYAYVRFALKKANHIITVSEFSKGEIERLFKIPEKDISVIPLAPPLQEGEPSAPDLPLRRPYLLYVGGYDERKNVPALMDAFQKHIANHYSLDLLLVGGKDKGLEKWLTNQYLEKVAGHIPVKPKGNIVLTPPLSPGELFALYRQATAFVHASYYEGFNIPLVEAMSHGLPIVAADLAVNREVTENNAVFVDPYSADAIGLGIHELLNHKPLQKELKEKGLARASHFSWKKCAEETLYVYNLFA